MVGGFLRILGGPWGVPRGAGVSQEILRGSWVVQISGTGGGVFPQEVEALLGETRMLQGKLQSQEDDFRLQNSTLLRELAKVGVLEGFGSTLGGSGGSQWGLGGFGGVGEVGFISLNSDFCFFSAADGETEEEAGKVRAPRSPKQDAGILFKAQRGVFFGLFLSIYIFFPPSFLQLQTEKETLLRDSRMELEELRARRDEEFRELQARNQQLQQELEAAAQVGAPGGGISRRWGSRGVLGGGVLGVPHGFVGVLGAPPRNRRSLGSSSPPGTTRKLLGTPGSPMGGLSGLSPRDPEVPKYPPENPNPLPASPNPSGSPHHILSAPPGFSLSPLAPTTFPSAPTNPLWDPSKSRRPPPRPSLFPQELKDVRDGQRILEKKGSAALKDLKRQLQLERRRADRLQERLQELLAPSRARTGLEELGLEGGSPGRGPGGDSSSLSSLGRDGSAPGSSPGGGSGGGGGAGGVPGGGGLSPAEVAELFQRLAQSQQERWLLEEKVLGGNWEGLGWEAAGPPGPPRRGTGPGEEGLREMNKKLQNMLEEQLTKNLHLGQDLEALSQELARLSKERTAPPGPP
uniref:Uncharacterized protein n=1 Tax=Accipiter nisus TaxID=211598 RepID=A0A8B9N250_9AVES